jgi:hypothetical protein
MPSTATGAGGGVCCSLGVRGFSVDPSLARERGRCCQLSSQRYGLTGGSDTPAAHPACPGRSAPDFRGFSWCSSAAIVLPHLLSLLVKWGKLGRGDGGETSPAPGCFPAWRAFGPHPPLAELADHPGSTLAQVADPDERLRARQFSRPCHRPVGRGRLDVHDDENVTWQEANALNKMALLIGLPKQVTAHELGHQDKVPFYRREPILRWTERW